MNVNNNLELVYSKLRALPTIMKVEQEIGIIKEIMKISTTEIQDNEELFYKILQSIYLSHEYNWYLLTDTDIEITSKFINILKKMDFLKDTDFLEDITWMLSLTPNNPPPNE